MQSPARRDINKKTKNKKISFRIYSKADFFFVFLESVYYNKYFARVQISVFVKLRGLIKLQSTA